MKMQTAEACENDSGTGINRDAFVAFKIEVRKTAGQCGENVFDSARVVLPGVRG